MVTACVFGSTANFCWTNWNFMIAIQEYRAIWRWNGVNWRRLVEMTLIFSEWKDFFFHFFWKWWLQFNTKFVNFVYIASFQMAVEMFDYLDDVMGVQATSKWKCYFFNAIEYQFISISILFYAQFSIPSHHSTLIRWHQLVNVVCHH